MIMSKEEFDAVKAIMDTHHKHIKEGEIQVPVGTGCQVCDSMTVREYMPRGKWRAYCTCTILGGNNYATDADCPVHGSEQLRRLTKNSVTLE